MTTIRGWHFVADTLLDGRPIPPDGEWLVHDGPVSICRSGLHGSERPWHALQYAPGPVLCYVECDGIVDRQTDKFVCRRRRIIVRADITETLRYSARMRALSVIHLYDDPQDVVLDYLMTGDESIRAAAWDAARAARTTARGAARAAAWAATWAARAARDAAWDTARAAAWDAARAAARAAARDARDAAWATARDTAWAAAWDTARAAAWDTARAADGHEFDALIYEQFGVTA